MATETNYNVNVRYAVDNRAGRKGTTELAGDVRQLERANRAAGDSFGMLGKAAAAAVGMFGLHEAKKVLIDFNGSVQNAKIGLSSMLQGNIGGTWDAATENAERLYKTFQDFSVVTPVTTQEIMTFGKAVAVSTFQAGGSIKDLTAITEQGVIAAKAFGYESAYSSLELSEMLAGNVNKRMMFAKQLLGMAHMEEGKFNALSGEKRLAVVRGVLDSDAMKNAQRAFAESWSGVTSTLEDKIQIGLGRVGMPLFKAVTAEIKRWSEWLDTNQVKVDHIVTSLGSGLADGFGVMKSAVELLIAHSDTIIAMGKIWLAVKLGGMLGGRATDGGGAIARRGSALMAWGRGASDGYDADGNYQYQSAGAGRQNVGLKGALANAGLLAQAGALGYTIGTMIRGNSEYTIGMDAATRRLKELELQGKAFGDALDGAANRMKGPRVLSNLQGGADDLRQQANIVGDYMRASGKLDSGQLGPNDSVNSLLIARENAKAAMEAAGIGQDDIDKAGGMQKFVDQANAKAAELADKQATLTQMGTFAMNVGINSLTDYQKQTLDSARAQQDVLVYMNQHGLRAIVTNEDRKNIIEILKKDTEDPEGKHKKIADKPNVNIHIARIEVQSDDPDRMAFGLIEFFRDAAKNPSSAVAALREG